MTAEGRWDRRKFELEESTTLNGSARTVFIEYMAPGTTVSLHFHTRFAETFDLISGSVSVYHSVESDLDALEASGHQLEVGEKATAKPGIYHKFKVGEEPTAVRIILTPGDKDFEKMLKIHNGLEIDGELGKMGDGILLLAVFAELCNGTMLGPAKEVLEKALIGKENEFEALKKDLFEKYDTEEALQDLLLKAE